MDHCWPVVIALIKTAAGPAKGFMVGLYPIALSRLPTDIWGYGKYGVGLLVIGFLAEAVFATSCGKRQTNSQPIDRVQTGATQAAQDMREYTYLCAEIPIREGNADTGDRARPTATNTADE
jgi:hypothetical protein